MIAGLPSTRETIIAGSGASRNDQYDAEKICTTLAVCNCLKRRGQYISCVTNVRTNLIRVRTFSHAGGDGLIGTSDVRTFGSRAQHAINQSAWTACPPRMRSVGATRAT